MAALPLAGCLRFGPPPLGEVLPGGGDGQQASARGVATLPFCAAVGLYLLSDAFSLFARRGVIGSGFLMVGWTQLQRVDIDSSYALVDRRHLRRPRCVRIVEYLALGQGLRGAQGSAPCAPPGRLFAPAGGVTLRAA